MHCNNTHAIAFFLESPQGQPRHGYQVAEEGRSLFLLGGTQTLLSTSSINKRLKEMSGYNFDRVVFSDEKIWRIRPSGAHVKVWRRKGDRYDAKYVTPSTSRSVGVMVWCGINGKGEMVWERCPDRVKAEDYQAILTKHLISFTVHQGIHWN